MLDVQRVGKMASLLQLKNNIPASKFIADFLSQGVNLKGDLVWKTFSYSRDNLNFYDFELRNKFVAFKSKEEWFNSFNFHALHEHESSVSESTLSAKSLDCINHLSHFNVYVLEFRGFEPTGFTTLSNSYSLECKNFCLSYQKVGHQIASLLVESSLEEKEFVPAIMDSKSFSIAIFWSATASNEDKISSKFKHSPELTFYSSNQNANGSKCHYRVVKSNIFIVLSNVPVSDIANFISNYIKGSNLSGTYHSSEKIFNYINEVNSLNCLDTTQLSSNIPVTPFTATSEIDRTDSQYQAFNPEMLDDSMEEAYILDRSQDIYIDRTPNNPSLQRPLSNEPLQHSSTSSRGPFLVNNSLPEPVAERTVNASTFSPAVMPQHKDLEHLLSLAGFMKYNESQSLSNNPSLQRPLSNEPLPHSSTSSPGPFLVNNSLPDCDLEKKSKISKYVHSKPSWSCASYKQVAHAMMASDCFLEDDEPYNPEMQIVSGVKLPEKLTIEILREHYHKRRYPNITILKGLSKISGYSEKVIRNWFRKKRKLEKFRASIERQQ